MSSGAKLWCFLLLIPFFAALAHDIYGSYMNTPEKQTRLEAFQIDPTGYQNSDLGYLFTTYVPTFYENVRDLVGADRWIKWVDPVLKQYTFVVALVPAVLFYIWLLISRIFDIWPFSGQARRVKSAAKDMSARRNEGAQFKYKRR
ncbi:MAG: hypothetical protein DI551_03070 [Micavibrio aeruginosavorus]|uniref:Uncharacterized protein n=1 Tax=Micavibrio aeruginosavorus TaxID=349221 RepID=A0A2W5N2P4_9BACT|nr:MAG: hypothetical protein DI551_03070 [Micavibrio aeruginosavorus]